MAGDDLSFVSVFRSFTVANCCGLYKQKSFFKSVFMHKENFSDKRKRNYQVTATFSTFSG